MISSAALMANSDDIYGPLRNSLFSWNWKLFIESIGKKKELKLAE